MNKLMSLWKSRTIEEQRNRDMLIRTYINSLHIASQEVELNEDVIKSLYKRLGKVL